MESQKSIEILIVEDEILLSFTMQEMLQDYGYSNIAIKNTFNDAVEELKNSKPQLAILDINLGGGPGGLELAKICFLEQIPFFYVTSYTDRKTLDLALETVPGAYVIKPVIPTNLYSAIKLSLKNLKADSFYSFKDGINNIKLNTNKLLYIEAEGIYLKIITEDKNYLVRASLISALQDLPENDFMQVHRSFVVNLNHIDKSTSNSIFIDQVEIPISRTYKAEFRNRNT